MERIDLNNLIIGKPLEDVIKILTNIKNKYPDKELEFDDIGIDECYLVIWEK